MKICFNELGPESTVSINEKIYINGSIVETDSNTAQLYVKNGLAFEIATKEDEDEARAVQRFEEKNHLIREEATKIKN